MSAMSEGSRSSYVALDRPVDDEDRAWLYTALNASSSLCGNRCNFLLTVYSHDVL